MRFLSGVPTCNALDCFLCRAINVDTILRGLMDFDGGDQQVRIACPTIEDLVVSRALIFLFLFTGLPACATRSNSHRFRDAAPRSAGASTESQSSPHHNGCTCPAPEGRQAARRLGSNAAADCVRHTAIFRLGRRSPFAEGNVYAIWCHPDRGDRARFVQYHGRDHARHIVQFPIGRPKHSHFGHRAARLMRSRGVARVVISRQVG
jgi:hypothetical protein